MSENRYIDTRGRAGAPIPFTQAVINGLADGGGLYVPEHIPTLTLDEICALAKLPYAQRAATIYKKFGVDLPDETIDALMEQTYGTNFDSKDICPIHSLDENTHVLELWHGPTSAFKDMALQCLPRFFAASAQKLRDTGAIDHNFLILVATSGDTGKAALEGFRDQPGVQIGVMYPHGGVSDIQYRQMATQLGNNVMVWAVRGNFDDCQTGAKRVFSDEAFAQKLMTDHRIALSSANSINWGRLLPQVVYYVSSYATLVADDKLTAGAPLDVCVPTGNFGNILAAWYAKQMGTPIGKLFCASNENRVLADFINTGTYDISHRKFILTPSPSMDILVSSNLERQLFEITGRNSQSIAQWMDDLSTQKRFSVDDDTFAKMKADFASDSVDSATCLATIRETLDTYNYLIDPHTAVAVKVAERLRGNNPVLIASTAHWAKFGENVYRALHGIEPDSALLSDIAALDGCALNRAIADEVRATHEPTVTGAGTLRIPAGLAALETADVRFTDVIDGTVDSIEDATLAFLNR